MRNFIETHWGDLIGLLLLYTGILLALLAAVYKPNAEPIAHLGESLVLAGMGVLKFRGKSGPSPAEKPGAQESSR